MEAPWELKVLAPGGAKRPDVEGVAGMVEGGQGAAD